MLKENKRNISLYMCHRLVDTQVKEREAHNWIIGWNLWKHLLRKITKNLVARLKRKAKHVAGYSERGHIYLW